MRSQKPLPAVPDSVICRVAGIEATLRGDASDPRIAWLQDDAGNDISLVWPPDWTARFSPRLEVVDAAGRTRLHDGDAVSSVCFRGPPNDRDAVVMIGGLGAG
jgi:hypothetical protein